MYIIGESTDVESVTDFHSMISFDAFYWMWVVELILEAADADLPTIYYSRIDGMLLVYGEGLFE